MDKTPLETLSEEHSVARNIVAILEVISRSLRKKKSISLIRMKELLEAIDKVLEIHHQKEMEIFPYLANNPGVNKSDLIEVLIQEHNLGYEYLNNILKIIDHVKRSPEEKYELLPFHIDQYVKLLDDHITKEESELFPMISSYLSEKQQHLLEKEFNDLDKRFNNRRSLYLIAQARRHYV